MSVVDDSLVPHFVELARVVRRVFAAWIVASIASALAPAPGGGGPLSIAVVRWLLSRSLPEGAGLFQANVFAGFDVAVRASLLVGLLAIAPYAAWEFYNYARPGLYGHERAFLRALLVLDLSVLYASIVVASYLFLPLIMDFYYKVAVAVAGSRGLEAFSDAQALLSTIMQSILSIALALQAPLLSYTLYSSRLLDPAEVLERKRLVLAGSFVVGAIFSPDPSGLGMILLGLIVAASLFGVAKIVVWRRTRGLGRLAA